MDHSTANSPAMQRRTRFWLALLGLAVVVGVVEVSMRTRDAAESTVGAPVSVARFRLENKAGQLFRPGSAAAFTGWMTDHAPDGKVRLRTAVVDGRLHGISEGWATNGTLELRESFHCGLPHGSRMTWHPNGQKRSEGQLVLGQQQGIFRQWTVNGALAAEAEFKDGKPHGLSRAWFPSGCLKAEALMNHGELVTRHFYPDGEQREATLLVRAPLKSPSPSSP